MSLLADLSVLSRSEQALRVRCPNRHNCGGLIYEPCRRPTMCPARWRALAEYRADLAFLDLGEQWHTGVPCTRCRASVGEFCRRLRQGDDAPAHNPRVEASARLAARLRDDYPGALAAEVL